MPIKNMTPEQIAEATRAQVTAGVKSTTKAAKLDGETQSEANARLTAAYKELVAKPILTQEQIDGGMKVQFVRTGTGGVGEYVPIKPIGYTGPTKVEQFTPGVIPEGAKYTTGSAVGLDTGGRTVDEFRKVLVGKLTAGNPLTAKEREWLDANGGSSTATSSSSASTSTKTVTKEVKNADGSTVITYSDGTTKTVAAPASGATTSTGLQTLNGVLYNNGVPFNGTAPDGKTYANGMVTTTGTNTTGVIPGSTGTSTAGGPTLAINTFKNTLALYFGQTEMTKPWVDGLYKSVSGFYKTGSSMEESFNLALMESKGNPNMTEFTKRFKGIYDLTELKTKGAVVTVPTIAQYYAAETTMAQVLTTAGLGSLANEEFLGNIIGKNVSVTEFTNRISKVYDRIDSAPAELKSTFARFFPSLDRVTLAKALLTGEKGAADLAKEVASYEIISASAQQGLGAIDPVTGKRLGIGLEEAGNIAAQGYGYQAALTGFRDVSQNLQSYEKLLELETGQDVATEDARKQLQDVTFGKLASAQRKADQLAAQEEARFRGASGLGRGGLTSQRSGII